MTPTKHQRCFAVLLSGVAFISLLLLSANVAKCALFMRGAARYHHYQDEHTIPTLLSVVDDTTGKYAYALDNPLYERIKQAVFITAKDVPIKDSPRLWPKQDTIEVRGALTLFWSRGRNNLDQPIVQDDDVILLFCDEPKPVLLDAATVSQAKATSKRHHGRDTDNHGNDMWHFPSFPVERHDVCEFRLYKALPRNHFAILARSDPIHMRDAKTLPSGLHLAFGDRVDEMVVQFKTGNSGTPIVKYGTEKNSMLLRAYGTSHTYGAKDMCQAPATKEEPGKFQPPGQLHVVRLEQLEPNTTYYYNVGISQNRTTIKWSDTHFFTSAPVIKADSPPHSFVVYGDQGCPSDGWHHAGNLVAAMATREANQSVPIRSVHHFGDLSYARGAAHIWDDWLNMISPFASKVPLMVSVGNHEYDHTDGGGDGKDPSGVPTKGGYNPKWGNFHKDSGGECGVPTSRHFTGMPRSEGSNGVFWYSYNFANVHTIAISSEHDMSPGSKQFNWLEQDLKSVDRSLLPWVILELHRPMYLAEFDPFDSVVGSEMLHRVENLLKTYHVDLVLSGHMHSYERSCAGLYKAKCNNGGPTHIMVGTAGANLVYDTIVPGIHWMEKLVRGSYGYGRITVQNATAMHFEFVRAGSENDPKAGKVLDDVWILKDQEQGLARDDVDFETEQS